MAKVSFNKLTPIKKGEDIQVKIGNEIILLKSYLPITEKSVLIEQIVNGSLDDTNHINDIKAQMLFTVYVILNYTNINFTDKQLESIPAIYDLLKLNKIDQEIFKAFNPQEYKDLQDLLNMTINHVNEYLNSFAGTLNIINDEQTRSQMDIDKMLDDLQTISNNSVLKGIMENMADAK